VNRIESQRMHAPVQDLPSIDAESVARVLSEIAETASETLELQGVFNRVAASIRQVIPFEHMGVVRLIEGGRAVQHAATIDCPDAKPSCFQPTELTNWSPRLRPRNGPNPRIDDAWEELDPNFKVDADILSSGVRSVLWEPFRVGAEFAGGVWLSSPRPAAFNDAHQQILRPIAALLGSAVEHWRIWDTERRRRERLDQLEGQLGSMAEALDVREVFGRLSEAIKPILPHDLIVLSELDVKHRLLRMVTVAGEADIEPPTGALPLSEEEVERRLREFEIMRDIPAEVAPNSERDRLIRSTGMRSWLRVPVWISGDVQNSLGLFHREAGRYTSEDVEVARRLADRIALMLSHHRLAQEARTAAEAQERAERLAATVETLTREMASRTNGRVIGVSRSWKDALMHAGRVAPSDTSVLITGESGTGKEVVSRLIYEGSPRAGKPFVAINCAALPEQLLESELFGHEKGAFTGAISSKVGRLEQAAGGTLFLDEIAEMTPRVQAKLLRVLQEREFQRVGGTKTLKADVRVIAATNRDLAAAIERQEFREDLYYRLNVFQIHIVPLRERREDILPLAEAFLEDLGRTMGRPAAGISRDARDWLLSYSWPGNVRELRNAIERAILLCDGGLITREHLPTAMTRPDASQGPNGHAAAGDGKAIPPQGVDLEAMERGFVTQALAQAKGNKSKAARLLNLTRAQLYTRLEKYGIS
jgi:transcriptional regulator with GAF, ATPase, and Fis domain